MCQPHGCRHDVAVPAFGHTIDDEAAIDLQFRKREIAKITEGRVAGAEVIDRKWKPERRNGVETGSGIGISGKDTFCHLNLKRSLRPLFLDRLQAGEQIGVVKFDGTDVDGNRHLAAFLLCPAMRRGRRRFKNPMADADDGAVHFGKRNEIGRTDQGAVAAPAHQRLRALYDTAGCRHVGLDMQFQFVTGDRMLERFTQFEALPDLLVQCRIEEHEDAATGILGPVRRRIGVAGQRHRIRAIPGTDRHTGPTSEGHRTRGQTDGFAGRVQQTDGMSFGLDRRVQFHDHNQELVAGHMGHAMGWRVMLLQPPCRLRNDRIAGTRAETVIDLAECVDVEVNHTNGAASLDGVLQKVEGKPSVRQPGELVIGFSMGQPCLDGASFSQVFLNRQKMRDLSGRIAQR